MAQGPAWPLIEWLVDKGDNQVIEDLFLSRFGMPDAHELEPLIRKALAKAPVGIGIEIFVSPHAELYRDLAIPWIERVLAYRSKSPAISRDLLSRFTKRVLRRRPALDWNEVYAKLLAEDVLEVRFVMAMSGFNPPLTGDRLALLQSL